MHSSPFSLQLLPVVTCLAVATAVAQSPAPAPVAPPGVSAAKPAPAANANVVSPDVLAPRLLLDTAELKQFLEAFPQEKYRVAEVPKVGRFYVDDINDYIKNELRSGKPWDPHLLPLIGKYAVPGSTVLDIGAHVGTMTIPLSHRVGAEGRVYSFEPQKKIYRELVKNLYLNKIQNAVPLRFAIGDRPAIIEMTSSPKKNEGHTSIGHGGDRAELRTIDSFGFHNLSFVKIDVESHEDEVLDGARETLLACHPVILIEIMGGFDHQKPSPKVRKQIDATIGKIEALGYSVSHVQSWDYLALPRK